MPTRMCPARPVPKSQLQDPPLPQALISGLLWEPGLWLMGANPEFGGLLVTLLLLTRQGGAGRRGSLARGRGGCRGTNQGGTKPCQPSGSWQLPHRSLGSPGPPGRQESGTGVRLQVWAPPEGDASGALPPGSSLGRRERSCPALSEPNTVLVSGKEHDQLRGSGCQGRGNCPPSQPGPHREHRAL